MSAIRALLLVVLACALVPLAPGVGGAVAAAVQASEEGEKAVVATEHPCRGKAAGIGCGSDLFLAPTPAAAPPALRSLRIEFSDPAHASLCPGRMLDPPRPVRAI